MSQRWKIFIVTSSLFFLSQFYRATNAVIAPQLMRDLSLSTEGLGTLSAAFFYVFALAQIPLSIFLDSVGAKRLMVGLSLVGVLGAFTFSWAHSLSMGIVGRALLGVGMSCNLMGTFKLLTLWFGPRSFAILSGVVFSIGTIGNMAATTPLVFMVEGLGWRIAFCVIGAVNLLLVLALYMVVHDRPPEEAAAPPDPSPLKAPRREIQALRVLFRMRDYWIISLGTFVRYGVFAAFQTLWAGPYLMDVMGFSPVTAGNLIFLMNLGLIFGSPTWGTLSDRLLKTRKWLVSSGLFTFAIITFIISRLSSGTGLPLLAFLFFGFGLFSSAGSLTYAHIKDLMPIERAGAAMTGINFFTMIGPAIFLQGLGFLMETLYPQTSRGPAAFTAALSLCTVCLALVSVLYLLTHDRTKSPFPSEPASIRQ